MSAKIPLATRSSKMGYLLLKDGDFLYPHYLGNLNVRINTRYTPERVMLTGHYEKDLWWAIENLVVEGDTCLDIGANAGAVTLYLAKRVGKTGRVVSFEPGPVFFERLSHNVKLNPDFKDRVELFNLGVSDKPGVLKWFEDPNFPGNAYLLGQSGIEVGVVTLDEAVLPKLTKLNFVKIDVEGMEPEVLRGARLLIEKHRPKIFMETLMEFEGHRQLPIRKDAERFLLNLGYKLYKVENDSLIPVQYPNFTENTVALPS